jgi:hypothetical protein
MTADPHALFEIWVAEARFATPNDPESDGAGDRGRCGSAFDAQGVFGAVRGCNDTSAAQEATDREPLSENRRWRRVG